MKHIFKLQKYKPQKGTMTDNEFAAPQLVPFDSSATDFRFGGELGMPGNQLIDVVNDFQWTHTPAEGRHEIPTIRMSEYKIEFNSLLSQLRYLLTAGKDIGADFLEKVEVVAEKNEVTKKILTN